MELIIDANSGAYVLRNVISLVNTYTFSIWYRTECDSQISFNVLGESEIVNSSTEWNKYVKTVTVETLDDPNIYIIPSNNILSYFYEGSLVEGFADTSWTPAPEDVESSVSSVRTVAEQTADKFTWLVDGDSSSTEVIFTESAIEAFTNQYIITAPDGTTTIIEGGKINTNSIVGENGEINLALGTFNYGNGKLSWDGKNLYIDAETIKAVLGDYYSVHDDVVNQFASIKSNVENIDLEVSQLSSQNGFAVGNVLQNYEGYDVPTLHNYPTFTDFFIWDVCSDELFCSNNLICGTNDYESHKYDVYKSTKYNRYYAFKENNGVYSWVQLTDAEYEILSSQYSSIKVNNDGIKLYSAQNEDSAYLEVKPDGVKASKIFCC